MSIRLISTEQFAEAVHVRPTTIRRAHCLDGHYMNVQPVKMPNRRLLWPAEQVEQLLAPETDR